MPPPRRARGTFLAEAPPGSPASFDSLRPASVPSWMSDLKGKPGVPSLPPRASVEHTLVDTPLVDTHVPSAPHRPRAPLGIAHGGDAARHAAGGHDAAPNPGQPRRRRRQPQGSVRRGSERSLSESWEQLRLFSKNNLGRRLDCEYSMAGAPSDDVHFVNVDECSDDASGEDDLDESANFDAPPPPHDVEWGSVRAEQSTLFVIPELPRGSELTLNILSTWGDPYYVGLMGLEVFDAAGHLVTVANVDAQLWADPPDINILKGGGDDPRTVDKLVDGVNHTGDDLHAWLAPFRRGESHYVGLRFDAPTTVSMIRIWNYNKSRIHSYRGARYVEMKLDDAYIFKGEVRRALGTGQAADIEDCSECILFTTSETTLLLIEKYDRALRASDARHASRAPSPIRARRELGVAPSGSFSTAVNTWTLDADDDAARPRTSCGRREDGARDDDTRDDDARNLSQSLRLPARTAAFPLNVAGRAKPLVGRASAKLRPSTAPIRGGGARAGTLPRGRMLELVILSNWGDPAAVGLAGLEILSEDFDVIEGLDAPHVRGVAKPAPPSPMLHDSDDNSDFGDAFGDGPGDGGARNAGFDDDAPKLSVAFFEAGRGSPPRGGLARSASVRAFRRDEGPLSVGASSRGFDRNFDADDEACTTPRSDALAARLLGGARVTTDPEEMWLLPHASRANAPLSLVFDLKECRAVGALKVWNYNASLEDSYCGVRGMAVYLDGQPLSQPEGFLIRKAPGNDAFDFGQFVHVRGAEDRRFTDRPQFSAKAGRDAPFDGAPFARAERRSSDAGSSSAFDALHAASDDEAPTPTSLQSTSSASTEAETDSDGEYRPRDSPRGVCSVPQQYETPLYPTGCIFKFVLLSTQGDPFYVGLNGMELGDVDGQPVELHERNVHAEPRDINVLQDQKVPDARTLDKLYDGVNSTFDASHAWLAPYLSDSRDNSIFVCFDEPQAISYVTFWNYAKTPARGVADLEIYVDDVLVFRGMLKQAPSADEACAAANARPRDAPDARARGGRRPKPDDEAPLDFGQTVLFSDDAQLLEQHRHRVFTEADLEQVLFIDEGEVKHPLVRPTTAVVADRRAPN
ncbi:hypothetical protein M885DRAFT_469901 [Pelagophyceae sp. CCMP2097]|nr:hypothetical protein M885DRAFT_469901 [Pelagophyceae sp. CCMP2097]